MAFPVWAVDVALTGMMKNIGLSSVSNVGSGCGFYLSSFHINDK